MERGKIAFAKLCHEELFRQKTRDGIGLYAEKTLHGLLKRWVCDDAAAHERPVYDVDGKKSRYVADVLTDDGQIFEVQTASLYPMHRKIAFYLESTHYRVTVVHPLVGRKWVSWLDPASGEVTARNRSPLHETPVHIMGELRAFLPFLAHPRFSLLLPIVEMDEFRFLDGWSRNGKRGSHRYELMPLSLLDTVVLEKKEDYIALFPEGLPQQFFAKDFSRATRLRGYALYDALHVFEALGVIKSGDRTKKGVAWCQASLP